MLRVVVDANVLVSALLNVDGAPARVVRSWLEGAFDLVVSPLLLRELDRVVTRPGLARRLDPLAVGKLRDTLGGDATLIPDPPPARQGSESCGRPCSTPWRSSASSPGSTDERARGGVRGAGVTRVCPGRRVIAMA